jgi:coenzyme F420-dependent glucose-6-phosphate dehydrogenase
MIMERSLLPPPLVRIGYHASHEQYSPRDLLDYVKKAADAGFDAAMCSDHLFPWSERQGHSGFAWSWLGAALEATSLPFGVVNAPGYRYHPVIIAQAAATLAQMYPGRFWIAVGSGEALNEHITGEAWPTKRERNQRLLECATIMRRLWTGETVTHRGQITAVEARVYSLPDRPPDLIAAAITAETAEWAGEWADGLITVSREPEELSKVIEAFHRGGGRDKRVIVQAKHSWAPREEEALRQAVEQWSTNVFDSPVAADLSMPHHFESLARLVSEDQVRREVRISADPARHAAWLRGDIDAGARELFIHNVGRQQTGFIDLFGREVLPGLQKERA